MTRPSPRVYENSRLAALLIGPAAIFVREVRYSSLYGAADEAGSRYCVHSLAELAGSYGGAVSRYEAAGRLAVVRNLAIYERYVKFASACSAQYN